MIGLIAVIAVAVTLHPRNPLVASTTTPTPTPSSAPSGSMATASSPPSTTTAFVGSPTTENLGRRILDVRGPWELFARSNNSLVRIQLADGRVTRTPIPALPVSGPVSLLVGPDRVIIHPVDSVGGFAIRDGHAAADLSAALRRPGPMTAGPDAGHIWAQTSARVMTLVDWNGNSTPRHFGLPETWSAGGEITSDGAGNVLITAADGSVYQGHSGGLELATTGTLRAVGPGGYLVDEHDSSGRWVATFIDRKTGHSRALANTVALFGTAVGVISPDGRTAAVIAVTVALVGPPRAAAWLVDLSSGKARPTGIRMQLSPSAGSMVWSPDSHWLILATDQGAVAAVDPGTGRAQDLGMRFPFVEQLAVRNG